MRTKRSPQSTPPTPQVQSDWTESNNGLPSFIKNHYVVQIGSANGSGNFTFSPDEANWLAISSGANDIVNFVQPNPAMQLEYNDIVVAPASGVVVRLLNTGNFLPSNGAPSITLNGTLREFIIMRWDIASNKYIQKGGKIVGNTLNNLTATTNPTVNDDAGDGYSAGSLWFNKSYAQGGGSFWICQDATPGAADWQPIRNAVQVNATPNASNDNTQGFFPGFLWLDLNTSVPYWCYSAATGAALWIPLMPLTSAVSLRGQWDASGNLFPTTGGTGPGGAVAVGDFWIISVAGTLGGVPVQPGDEIISLVAVPAQILANWCIISRAFGYIPENEANKSNDTAMTADSATLYPTQHAAKTYIDAGLALKLTKSLNLSDVPSKPTGRSNLQTYFPISLFAAQFNPADSTTYYFGASPNSAPTTTINISRTVVPIARTLLAFSVSAKVLGTLGSAQNVTITLMRNGVATVLTGTFLLNAANNTAFFSPGTMPFAAGDTIEARIATPGWPTNPTQVQLRVDCYFV